MIKSCSTFLRVCITITTIIILAGITSEVSGQSEGLIAAYGFNTGTNPYIDSSGNSLSLTCSPSSCPTYTTTGGHDNSGGIDFSGAGDSLTIPSEHLFDFTNQMTVSFWMKNDRFDNLFESIVAKGTSSWAVGRYYYSRNATFYTTSQGAIHFSSPSFTVDNNAWHHIAVTYDGARKKFYVDGTLRSNQPYTRIIDQNNVAVTLGYNLQNNAYEYSGILDDVRIYNRALSATEITNDMNLPVGNVFPSATPSATSSPTLTFTPTSTFTPLPPTSTYTPLPTNTSTFTPLPPTSTFTPLPPPSTFTPLPTTSTYTPIPTNTSTFTPLPPTSTFTSTPIPTFTNTALPPSPTYTPPPFNTPTITASPGVTTGPVQAGRQVAYTSTLADDRQYLLFLPNNYYTPPPGGWPVIMFFHGAGIGERWGVNGIRWEALPGMLGSRPDFPFIVISPRIYFSADLLGGSGWLNPTATNSMYVLLNEIQNSYQVNTNKTYLTGYSLGGGAVWNLGITYPEKFAALAPVGGFFQTHMSLTVPPNICDLYEKPIRSYHGTNDATINISLARGIIDAVNDCGAFDYAELIEGSWSHNNVDNSAYTANDDLYDWMLTHSIP